MIPHMLNPCFERVVRAEEHLADLRHRLEDLFRRQENSIICQFDPNPPYILKATAPDYPMPPMRVGVLIGEICYNLRSALDYLIFELARHDSGSAQNGTQFPIEDTKRGFKSREKTWLKGINLSHIAAIETLQPYRECDWTKALRDLSNRDKHREFAQISGSLEQMLALSAIRDLITSLARYVAHHIPSQAKWM
jgi:hypothetical protein